MHMDISYTLVEDLIIRSPSTGEYGSCWSRRCPSARERKLPTLVRMTIGKKKETKEAIKRKKKKNETINKNKNSRQERAPTATFCVF
jgi:hypothetical protein